jgi:hypothetical protein
LGRSKEVFPFVGRGVGGYGIEELGKYKREVCINFIEERAKGLLVEGEGTEKLEEPLGSGFSKLRGSSYGGEIKDFFLFCQKRKL